MTFLSPFLINFQACKLGGQEAAMCFLPCLVLQEKFLCLTHHVCLHFPSNFSSLHVEQMMLVLKLMLLFIFLWVVMH